MGLFSKSPDGRDKELPPPQPLCSGCRTALASLYNLGLLEARQKHGVTTNFTSQPWRDAASCRVCALLVALHTSVHLARLRALYCEQQNQYLFSWVAKDFERTYAKGQIHVQVDRRSAQGSSATTRCEWASNYMHVKWRPTSSNIPRMKYLADSTSSSSTMKTIKKWLVDCDHAEEIGHFACRELAVRKPEDRWWRPRRLLDLDSLDQYQVIGLNQRAKPKELVTYATLSYSWGSRGNLMLKKDVNYQNWRNHGIPWNDIPRVIQDAIQVTKQLGVRFLWVDSLCLLQGGEEWQYESTEMAKTYSLAYFNIIADKANDCRSSMFEQRDPNSILFSGALVQPSKEKGGIFRPSRTTDLWLGPLDPWESITVNSHTKSRAWVMQEELLARRRIHFAKDQVFWQCNGRNGCETFPAGLEGASSDHVSHEFGGLRTGKVGSKRQWYNGEAANLFEPFWLLLIEEYTSRRCTAQSDRLIAIAGIAEVLGQLPQTVQTQNRYLAGLWLNKLEWFLCWRVTSMSQYSRHTEDYIGPSWSWASAIGRIRMDVINEVPRGDHWDSVIVPTTDSLIELIDIDMQPAPGLSDYYKVTGGTLRVRGHLFAVRYENDMRKPEHTEITQLLIGADRDPASINKPYQCWPDDGGGWINGSVFFLPILRERSLLVNGAQQSSIKGILIRRARSPRAFKRVAYLSIRCDLNEVADFVLPGKSQHQLGTTDVIDSCGKNYYEFNLI